MQKTVCNSLLFFLFGDLERRDLSHKEKLYLRELNVITETQCTLGSGRLRGGVDERELLPRLRHQNQ